MVGAHQPRDLRPALPTHFLRIPYRPSNSYFSFSASNARAGEAARPAVRTSLHGLANKTHTLRSPSKTLESAPGSISPSVMLIVNPELSHAFRSMGINSTVQADLALD